MRASVVPLPLLVMIGGCGYIFAPCEEFSRAGIAVTPIDATSGQVVSGNVTVIATSGSYSDTAFFNADSMAAPVYLAEERGGVYSVFVRVEKGYQRWQRDGIRVEDEDHCHVRQVQVIAELLRIDGP